MRVCAQALSQCFTPHPKLPQLPVSAAPVRIAACSECSVQDLLTFFTDERRRPQALDVLREIQFIIVHNNMDAASVDYVRRCNCAMVMPSSTAPAGVVASCMGCI
jgi:hypothetical protein